MTNGDTGSTNGVKVKTPFGWFVDISGRDIVLILLIIAFAGLEIWRDQRRSDEHMAIERMILSGQASRSTQVETMNRTIIDLYRLNYETLDYQNKILRAICRNQVPLQAQGQCDPRYRGYEEK